MAISRLTDEIFQAALALEPEERSVYVQGRCGGDDALEDRVMALLAAADSPEDPIEERLLSVREQHWQSAFEETRHVDEDLTGQHIDHWHLTRQIARGGLATVYLAQRDDGTFEQTAAFKVLRRGLDTDDLIARFRAERQILSTLDHPAIAGILDGGALPDGRPYLVLEYIDGESITRWCENRNCSIEQRLELLIDVLSALQHAHSRLIVHRDIKPSNILVGPDGRVSLLDFGIAKILDPDAFPTGSASTRTGISLLTPGYGSPEQYAGHAVTTASDVYQVGTVMYELLTGERAFSAVPRSGELQTPVPSRQTREPTLRRKLRGDLDAIVLKAMHPEPDRRYGSAAQMQSDLQCYLQNKPIQARPDSLGYRFSKLMRRRPWLAPVVVAAVLAVAGYITTLALYTQQLQTEQGRTLAAQNFLVNLLGSADPFTPADPVRGRDITVVEALDLGVTQLRAQNIDDLELKVTLLNAISGVYASLDRYEAAIELREESLAIERSVYGNDTSAVVDSLLMLSQQYRAIGAIEQSIGLSVEALAIARRIYGENDPRLGAAEAAAARVNGLIGDREQGAALLEGAIEKMRGEADVYAPHLINALVAHSGWQSQNQDPSAIDSLTEALTLARRYFGDDSLSAALVHAQAASILSASGDFAAAEPEFDRALDIYDTRLGPDHGATIAALNNFALMFVRMGDFVRAEMILRDVVARHEAKYGTEYFETAAAYQNLATALSRQGRYEESVPMHEKAAAIYTAVLPGDNQVAAFPHLSLAYAHLELDDPAAADSAARRALDILTRTAPATWMAGVAECLLGLALERDGRTTDAERHFRSARSLMAAGIVPDPYQSLCPVDADN